MGCLNYYSLSIVHYPLKKMFSKAQQPQQTPSAKPTTPFFKPEATFKSLATEQQAVAERAPEAIMRLPIQSVQRQPNASARAQTSNFKPQTSNHNLPIQAKLTVGQPNDKYEQEADAMADKVIQRWAMPDVTRPSGRESQQTPTITPFNINAAQRACAACEKEDKDHLQRKESGEMTASPSVESRLSATKGGGSPLSESTRSEMGAAIGADFSNVRIHTGGEAVQLSQDLSAHAFTHGSDVYFNSGKFSPHTEGGRHLLAHELVHTVQQGRASIQRKIEMNDVGRGEQSGFARLPELVERLNAISQGLIFSMTGNELTCVVRIGGTLSYFDQQMQIFTQPLPRIPLRLTNRHALIDDGTGNYNNHVFEDDWASGYVDIDDLLGSTDLGLQLVLVHFLQERMATHRYAQRIGTLPIVNNPELNRAHDLGLDAELELLRDFFGDPTIRYISRNARTYRNSKNDRLTTHITEGHGTETGIQAVSIVIVTHDGQHPTPEEYREILRTERLAAINLAARHPLIMPGLLHLMPLLNLGGSVTPLHTQPFHLIPIPPMRFQLSPEVIRSLRLSPSLSMPPPSTAIPAPPLTTAPITEPHTGEGIRLGSDMSLDPITGTWQISAVVRGLHLTQFRVGRTDVDFLHEPSVSVGGGLAPLSVDDSVSFGIALFNWHLREGVEAALPELNINSQGNIGVGASLDIDSGHPNWSYFISGEVEIERDAEGHYEAHVPTFSAGLTFHVNP